MVGVARRWLLLLVVLLIVSSILPIAFLALGSLAVGSVTIFPPYALNSYLETFAQKDFESVIVNTIIYASGSTLVSLALSLPLAWYLGRYSLRAKGFFTTLAFFGLIMPAFVQAAGWIMLLNPNNGLINILAEYILGTTKPLVNIYSMVGMILIQGLVDIPFAFAPLVGSVSQFDRELESAAHISGGGTAYTMARVTFPLLIPGIITAVLLTFARSMESFSVPLFIGQSARITVMSTKVYFAIASGVAPQFNIAAVYSVLLTIPVGMAIYLSNRIFSTKKYQFLKGQSLYQAQALRGRAVVVGYLIVGTILGIIVFLPFGVLLYASFLPYYQPPSLQVLSLLSLSGYAGFLNGVLTAPIINSLIFAALAGIISVIFSLFLAYARNRTGPRLSGFISTGATLTYAVPGVTMALAMIWTYIYTPIYATMWILVIAYFARYNPACFRGVVNGLSRVSDEMEEAAVVSGAGVLTRLGRILTPIIRSDIVGGSILVVASAYTDISMTIFLYTASTITVSVSVYSLYIEALIPQMAAEGVMATIVLFVVLSVIKKVFKA